MKTEDKAGSRPGSPGQLPEAQGVRMEGLDRLEFGHSAETLLLTIGCWWSSKRRGKPQRPGDTFALWLAKRADGGFGHD